MTKDLRIEEALQNEKCKLKIANWLALFGKFPQFAIFHPRPRSFPKRLGSAINFATF